MNTKVKNHPIKKIIPISLLIFAINYSFQFTTLVLIIDVIGGIFLAREIYILFKLLKIQFHINQFKNKK